MTSMPSPFGGLREYRGLASALIYGEDVAIVYLCNTKRKPGNSRAAVNFNHNPITFIGIYRKTTQYDTITQ